MLDIGWGELLIIGVVALIVVGPKDLPALFKTAGSFMGKARGMAREFQRSMEAAADDTGLKEASQGLKAIDRLNYGKATSSARKYAETLVKGIDDTVAGAAKPAPPAAVPPAAAVPAAARAPTPDVAVPAPQAVATADAPSSDPATP